MKNLPAKEIALTRGAARFDTKSLLPRVDRPEMRSSSQRDEEQLVLNKINNFKFHFKINKTKEDKTYSITEVSMPTF